MESVTFVVIFFFDYMTIGATFFSDKVDSRLFVIGIFKTFLHLKLFYILNFPTKLIIYIIYYIIL